MSGAPPIVLEDVCYFYGQGNLRKQVLYDVDATIDNGEIVILNGPSGSGKTTLLSLIGGLRSGQGGSVKVLGEELNGADDQCREAMRRQIGFLFRHHNLLDSLTVTQNIQMALELSGPPPRKNWNKRIESVLEQVGMSEHHRAYPAQLSRGQRQRIGIARALVTHPRVILADDPTADLDRESGRTIVNLLQHLAREEDASVLLVTNDNRILDIADRVLHLEDGRVRELADAVADDSSRMLNILARHEPAANSYLAAFALALTRVASADNVITDDETHTISRILHSHSDLSSGEVELVMALSRCLVSFHGGDTAQKLVSPERGSQFLDALRAVAEADGEVSDDELEEIRQIVTELGIT